MAIMTIAGEAFNVLVEGDETKPALIISNPLGTNLHLWDRQMPALLEHFRVVRYDSRGHGESVADEGPYSIERLGRDALAILDALGIEKAHWLGLSKGGMVGLWVLAYAPGRMGRAVLANTAAQVPGPDLWNGRIRSARETGMEGVADVVAERWFTKGFRDSHADEVESVLAMVRATPLAGYIACCAAVRDMDLREAMRGIKGSVLVIVGRHDPSTPPGMGALVASSIEGARLVTLETSHMSCVEDPENFANVAVDFLTGAEPVGKAAPARREPAGRKMAATTAVAKAQAKKAPAKKAAAKKAALTKPAVKKAPAKKAAAKKAVTKKAEPKKTPAPKVAAKKAAPKKAAAKRLAVKGAAGKKAPPKKAASKKIAVKAAPAKKVAGKKVAGKIAPSKKASLGKAPVTAASAKKVAAKKPATKPATGRSLAKKALLRKPAGPKKK